MSFFTALLDYTGARNQAKSAAQQQAYENALQEKQLGIDEQNAATNRAVSQAQLEQYQQAIQQQQANRQFESGLQLPKGWSGMQPDQRIAYLTQRYNAAQRAGDAELAKSTLDEMNSLELGAERLANANYTNQGKLPLAQAQAQEANARAGYYRNVLGVDLAKARMQLQAAQGNAAAHVRAAEISAAGALQRAGISAQAQEEGRILAGYFAMQGRNASDATQMAIHAAADANKYAQQSALLSGQPAPAPVTAQQLMPNISISTGGDDGALSILAPIVKAIMQRDGVKVPASNGNQQPPKVDVQTEVSHIRQAISAGVPQARIVQTLQKRMKDGQVSPQDEQAILRAVFGSHP